MVTAPKLLSEPSCIWNAGATLGEGLCWSPREQALYWVDILGCTLYRCNAQGQDRQEWAFGETISAVAERREGPGLAVTLRRGLALFDPATGSLRRLHEPEPHRPGNRFNDGKCDAEGRFWGGSMDFGASAPTGALYCFGADGRADCAADVCWPVTNGPAWSLDGRTLYANNTVHREVMAFDFDAASGTVSRPRTWLRFTPEDGHPDGMTTDAEGRLWIAHWGGACVSCHHPDDGRELLRVPLPTSHVSNVAFGGPGLHTLFITSARHELSRAQLAAEPLAGALFAVETDATGLPAHRFAG